MSSDRIMNCYLPIGFFAYGIPNQASTNFPVVAACVMPLILPLFV